MLSGACASLFSRFFAELIHNVKIGEVEFLDVWKEAYTSIMKHARATDGFWVCPRLCIFLKYLISFQYRNINIYTGEAIYFTVDSLSAFWPGLQVLAGDVQNAVKSHLMCE